MIRSIFVQLWNCRKANLSVFLELLCVFGLLWYITDFLFVYTHNRLVPDFRNTEHTWRVNVGILPPGHPEYRAEENEPQAMYDNFHRLLRIMQDNPEVETVGVMAHFALPGNGSYRGRSYYSLSDTSRHVNGQSMEIHTAAGTDYFHVFRHTRGEGAAPASVNDFDWTQPRAVVVSRSVAEALFPNGNAIGQQIVHDLKQSSTPMTVIGVVDDTKRFDYLRTRHAVYIAITGMDEWELNMWRLFPAIVVRSHASIPDRIFAESFAAAMENDLRAGNFFFKNMLSCRKIAKDMEASFGVSSDLQVRIYLMAFFLLNILLCVLGTFWYKVNLRRSETGLRKAMGAGKASIRNAFFIEGLCLLTFAALVAMAIEMQFVAAGLIDTLGKGGDGDTDRIYLVDRTALRFLITNGLTFLILATVILTAIAIPARRAAALHPVEALHYE
jgi:hypothetical protein